MHSSLSVLAAAALLGTQSMAVALPNPVISSPAIARRAGGIPDSNAPGMSCFNTWETITQPPVVQYWYVVAPNVGNDIKADRVWNHLNLNGCAPTENKYYARSDINGSTLTFHTSEACTAARVSHALRSGSDPGVNIACLFTSANGDVDGGEAAAEGINAVLEGIFSIFGDE